MSERKSVVMEAIRALPKMQQRVVTLRYYENLTAEEIAKVLDITLRRVLRLHVRAIGRVARAIARADRKRR